MRAWLIRHAHYPLVGLGLGGRAPHALSDEGERQARALVARLRDQPVAAVISSPILRAQQTAAPLAEACGLVVETDAAFSEIDFGVWTGRHFAALEGDPAWRRWNDDREGARAPGGETMIAVQERAVRRFVELGRRFEKQTVAIVSHGDVIKAIVLPVLGLGLNAIHRLDIPPAGVVVVEEGRVLFQ